MCTRFYCIQTVECVECHNMAEFFDRVRAKKADVQKLQVNGRLCF